jgi:hypothetical protein
VASLAIALGTGCVEPSVAFVGDSLYYRREPFYELLPRQTVCGYSPASRSNWSERSVVRNRASRRHVTPTEGFVSLVAQIDGSPGLEVGMIDVKAWWERIWPWG